MARAKKTKPETPVTPITRPSIRLDPHVPVPVEISGADDHALLLAAVKLYAKHLAELQTKAEKMDRTVDARRYGKEIEGLDVELVEQFTRGEHNAIYPRHMPIIAAGLDFLETNLKAAKGTLGGLGAWTAPWIESLDSKAGYVGQMIRPKFADTQAEIELPDGKAAAAGERAE